MVKLIQNPFQGFSQLQTILTAPAARFARQRNRGYVSSQEQASGTHQVSFRKLEKS